MPHQFNKPLSAIDLDDTVANFPSLKLKFSREGMADNNLSITCPISGIILSSTSAFNLVGDTGFTRSSVTAMDGALTLSDKDFLCLVNADIINANGSTDFGKTNTSGGAIKAVPASSYSYYDGNTVGSNYVTMGATAAGDLSAIGVAVGPQLDFGNKYSIYADGTTAAVKTVGAITGTFDKADWTINSGFLLGSNTTITYHSIYVLEFANGIPDDTVITQGMQWMAANRDKGLPPMWKDLA